MGRHRSFEILNSDVSHEDTDSHFLFFSSHRKAIRIVKHAFEIIHLITGKNPLQVFVDAVMKAGPREDSTRIGSAGVVRRQVSNREIMWFYWFSVKLATWAKPISVHGSIIDLSVVL